MARRGGRKRKQGKREPNGKLSRRKDDKQVRRSIDEKTAMQVAREARERVFGVKESESATELAGSVCGRLFLIGMLDRDQLEAAKTYGAAHAAYLRAIDAPPPPKAVVIGAPTGRSDYDVDPEWANRARSRWADAKRVLVDENMTYRGSTLIAACDYLVLRDEMHSHLIGDLRLGLNALARHYGLLARAA